MGTYGLQEEDDDEEGEFVPVPIPPLSAHEELSQTIRKRRYPTAFPEEQYPYNSNTKSAGHRRSESAGVRIKKFAQETVMECFSSVVSWLGEFGGRIFTNGIILFILYCF